MSHWEWVVATLVGVVSVARTARLIIFDELPPMVWLRVHILARYKDDSKWSKLWECQYCMTPYLSAGMLAWAWISDLHWTWWVINGVWAGSYIAAILVSYDQPEEG